MRPSRIPTFTQPVTRETAQVWFGTMQAAGLLFHPEDDPASIIAIGGDDTPVFTPEECTALTATLATIDAAGAAQGFDPCELALSASGGFASD